MSANNVPRGLPRGSRRQAGAAAVEFAIVAIVFFMLMFGILELARSMYLFNALQDVTARAANAASHVDFHDASRLDTVRQDAIYRSGPGTLLLGDPVTDANVRIDYLAATRGSDGTLALTPIPATALPSSPARNRAICMGDPNDSTCIRFVRARICRSATGDSCAALRYQTVFPFITLPLNLPTAPTVVSANSLGFVHGMLPGT